MSACNPHGIAFKFAKPAVGSAIRFTSVSECPVVISALQSFVKRAPQGGNFQSGTPPLGSDWAFYQTDEYKTLRFAMQSFPSKWFAVSIHHRHALLIAVI